MEGDTEHAKNAILTVDEIREELGKEPFKDVKEASMPGVMTPNNGFIPLSIDAAQPIFSARQQTNTPPADPEAESETPAKGKGKQKTEKAAITPDKLSHASQHAEERIGSAVASTLKRMRAKTLAAIRNAKS
jgi:hypothetical protein